MADPIDLDKMFGNPNKGAAPASAPTKGATPGQPQEGGMDLEKMFGDPTKGGKQTPAAAADQAYEEKVQGLLPRAREEVKGGLTGGYATAFARGVGDIPFIGPAGEAASRAVLAGLGKGEGKNFSERYEQLRAEDEALRRAYSEGTGHKIAGLAGQVTGAIATLPTGLGAAAGTAAAARGAGTVGQTAAKIAGYGVEGAGYGAATAAGEQLFGTQPESEKPGIGQAAVLGGGLGAGLGAAGLGVGKAYQTIAPDWVKTFGRTDNAQWNRLGQAAQKDIAAGDVRMQPVDVMDALKRGQPVAVMDMYGQNFRNEAANALKKNPEILQDWQTHTMQRLNSQNERFEDFITRLRGTAENPNELNQRAMDLAKRQSDARYEQVLRPGVGSGSWDRSWDFWLKSPSFRKAVVETENEIRDSMALQGRDPASFMSPFRPVERIDPKTGLKFTPKVAGTDMPEWAVAFRNRVDIPYLDKLQRNLNNVIDGRYGAEFTPRGDSAKGLSGARREILDALTDPKGKFYNPLYAETRSKYSDFSDQRTALQFGADLLKKVGNARDAAALASKAKYMSAEERELAQHGLLTDLLARAQSRSQPNQINAAKLESYLKTPYIRDAMESILLPKTMQNLQRYIHTENMISQVAKDVAKIRPEPGASQEVRTLLWAIFSAPAAAARWVGLWGNQKMGEKYAQSMFQKISSQDPNDFRDVMQMIAQNPSLRRSLGEFALSAAGKAQMGIGVGAGNLPQFAMGGAVGKRKERNQHIQSATQGLLDHAATGMARGGEIDEASDGLMQEAGDGNEDGGTPEHPLNNDVYHGTQADFSEFRNDPQQHSLSLGLGIHVAKDPAISNSEYFTARGGDPRHGGRPGGNVMPMKTVPDEKFFPIHQPYDPDMGDYYHDDWAIRNEIMAHVYQNNPDLFVKDMMQQRKISKEEALNAHEKLSNGERWHDPSGGSAINFRGLVKNYALQPYSPEDREMAIRQFRKDLRDQGYEGVKYINTSTEETKNAKDKTSYIVFPDEKQPGEWFPLRSRFAKFNPEDSHKADITKADGGEVEPQHFDEGGSVLFPPPEERFPPNLGGDIKSVTENVNRVKSSAQDIQNVADMQKDYRAWLQREYEAGRASPDQLREEFNNPTYARVVPPSVRRMAQSATPQTTSDRLYGAYNVADSAPSLATQGMMGLVNAAGGNPERAKANLIAAGTPVAIEAARKGYRWANKTLGGSRPVRATGGRIPEVDKLFKAAKRAMDGETKQVLHTPDDIVVQALHIAKTLPRLKG